jgi:ATP-dependent DNA helicase DinG
MLNQVARLLEEPLREAGIRLLVHGASGTRDQLTRVFRAGGACVLLGTHSFWEGVDVAGEALSCVVMARLPFAAVGDPVNEARCEAIERSGGSAFREFSLPQAVIRFRQGFGRLIRTRADKGIVIVADPRVVTMNYGSTFRMSLPCPLHKVETRAELLARVEALFG